MIVHHHDAQVAAYGRCLTCRTLREAAEAARDAALQRVAEAAPASWLTAARLVIEKLARDGQEFTSDDVWARLPHPPEPRALGAVMRSAAVDGIIESTGRTRPSIRPDCHARPVAIWRCPQAPGETVDNRLW